MKKIKFLGAAVLAASLIFAGCSSPAGAVPEINNPIDNNENNNGTGQENNNNNNNNENGQNENNNNQNNNNEQNENSNQNNENNGENSGSETHNYTAPAITDYYKNYLVSSPAVASNKTIADWGAGSTATPNADGTWSIASSGSMWDGIGGVCTPFTGFEAGTLAGYEYIVFTVDTTDYVINTTDDGPGNAGVNVKVPETQVDISGNYVANGNVRTYYAPLSAYGTAPSTATEFAIIIGGSGTLKLNEVYFAAAEDPSNKAVTGITITPETASLEQNGTQQFTVKDSNYVNRTSDVTYSLTGDAAEGSTITEDGLLTVGTTAGSLTVTASYTVGEDTFTSSATITVMGAMTNIVHSVTLEKYLSSAHPDTAPLLVADGTEIEIEDQTVILHKAEDGNWGEWSCQLFLKVEAEEGKIFEADKKYYVSVTVNSSADLVGCVWKEDMGGSIDQHGISYVAGESKTLTAEIENVERDYFKCLLSFPGAASDITVSNVIVYDITE